jgi:KDO2-lipid IV(A) lauroyltransferase
MPVLPADRSLSVRTRHAAEYAALRLVSGLLEPYPPDRNLVTAARVADLAARLSPRRIDRARANIARSFPGIGNDEIDRIAAESMRHLFGLFLVDAMVMPRVVREWSWPRLVRFDRFTEAMRLLAGREPCLFLTGHVGNWELLGYLLALVGFRMTALARPLDNPLLSDWLFRARESSGLRVITKWGATDEVQRVIEAGGKVGFIADQNAGDDGLFVPFFGRLASSYKSIGLLAIRYRIPVVAGYAARLDGRFRYEVRVTDVIRPEDWEPHPDPLFYLTARYARALEAMAREEPGQYLWIHRRWKSRPRHEREGKPMPDRLRAKLESLPWMTPELLGQCATPVQP